MPNRSKLNVEFVDSTNIYTVCICIIYIYIIYIEVILYVYIYTRICYPPFGHVTVGMLYIYAHMIYDI